MDANAERVIARLYAVETPMPKAKIALHAYCQALVPNRAGDFAQALMDLGSAICTPKRPACPNCPWTEYCEARKLGIQERLPVKAPKMLRPLKRGAAFVAIDRTGAVLLVKRPDKGLLASMLEPPLGEWTEDFPSPAKALKQAPFEADWKKRSGVVRHGFTHFELEIEVYAAQVFKHPKLSWPGLPGPSRATGKTHAAALDGPREVGHDKRERWVPRDDLKNVALPTVMRKIVEHGLDEGGPLFSSAKPRA
jgi:A/G-specific adenine glycosylase